MTTPTINWRRREEHGETFGDGETLFVKTADGETLFDVIVADPDFAHPDDEDGYVAFYANGEDLWRRDWEDVVWWVPIEEIEASLPKPTE